MNSQLDKIKQKFKPIGPDYIGADLDNGIQLYNIIEWVLEQSGPASIWVVTFSLSEEFIRKMLKLQKSGLITSVVVITDFKASQKTNKLIRFSENVFDVVKYCKTHAKIVIIEADNLEFPRVVITGSQNATRGNRHESTVITTNEEIYLQLKNQVENMQTMSYDIHR